MEQRYYEARIAALDGAANAAASKAIAEVAEKRADRAAKKEASLRRAVAISSSPSSPSSSSHDQALMQNLSFLDSALTMRADLAAQSARESAVELRRLLAQERDAADAQARALAVATRLAAELPSIACRLEVAEQNEMAMRAALADAEDRCSAAEHAAEFATERAATAESYGEELRRYVEGLVMASGECTLCQSLHIIFSYLQAGRIFRFLRQPTKAAQKKRFRPWASCDARFLKPLLRRDDA